MSPGRDFRGAGCPASAAWLQAWLRHAELEEAWLEEGPEEGAGWEEGPETGVSVIACV